MIEQLLLQYVSYSICSHTKHENSVIIFSPSCRETFVHLLNTNKDILMSAGNADCVYKVNSATD